MLQDTRVRALLALLAAVAAVGITITVVEDDRPDQPRRTVTITLGKPKAPGAVATEPVQVEVPAAAVRQAASTEVGEHDDLKTETPAGASLGELEDARDQQDRLAETDQLPVVTPDAAPSQRGCATRLVANRSSRRGVRPRLLVVHYTVSPNRPGWSDVWAVTGLFDRPSFAASSTWIIDSEGHCAYIVRESDKPWTQAAANPVSLSVEVINSGREGRLADPAGLRKIGLVFSDAARRWEIPLQRGQVRGCTVTRPGIIDHHALGACGGGHVDVSPYTIAPVLTATKAARGGGITSVDKTTCRKLNWWRGAARPHGAPERNAIRRRQALERRGVTCSASGPVRRR